MWPVRSALCFSLVVSFLLAAAQKARRNNVCRTFEDYYKLDNSSNCYYDPAAEFEVVRANILFENQYKVKMEMINYINLKITEKTKRFTSKTNFEL